MEIMRLTISVEKFLTLLIERLELPNCRLHRTSKMNSKDKISQ
jgi:hypothetical protein